MIQHLAFPTDWQDARAAGDYRISTRGRTLAEEGFLHCSRPDQVRGVVDAFYAHAGPLLLLTIDPDLVTSPVRDDEVAPGRVFPHIYGPLNLDAVVDVAPLDRGGVAADPSVRDAAAGILPELRRQEETLVWGEFTHDTAWALGARLIEVARRDALPISVAVMLAGQRVFHAARPGTTAEQDSWLDRKARVVELFGASSYRVGTMYRAQGTTFEDGSGLDPVRYAAHGGAFPLRVRGAGVAGSVAVSGLAQKDDHDVVVRELAGFLGTAGTG